MKIDYLCNSWQFMLQQIVYLVSKGYIYYSLGEIPLDKSNKARSIDSKIIHKYNMDLSKHQRTRRKQKKLANFYYLRWKNQFVILRTEGKLEEPVDDVFYNIKSGSKGGNKFKINIGKELSVNIVLVNGKATVVLDKGTYKDIKTELDELVKNKQIGKLYKRFSMLNSIPAWSGIVKQKFLLQEEIFKAAKKYGLNTKKKNQIKYPCQYDEGLVEYPLWINTYRKPVNKEFMNQEDKEITEWL
ncbi:hypothetical protein [Clostridium perfringens]|uniref:hypothetical protein n=1 Tax=Clostridium perfringens TaxID=1502 RepID=UPI0032DAB469